jgi:L-methionine (R)-S-oxide reductase
MPLSDPQKLATENVHSYFVQLATLTAKILDAENCSLILLDETSVDNQRVSICASYGPLPLTAYPESISKGIAKHIVKTGKSLLIEDTDQSEFVECTCRSADLRKSLIFSPFTIDARIVGIANVSGGLNRRFNLVDLNLLEVVALFIGKSIQVIQLQNILNSNFAQLALVRDGQTNSGSAMPNPEQVAKILAKSFYKEMVRAGLETNQIIDAASEIITQLSISLQRHSKRQSKRHFPEKYGVIN